MGCKSSTPLSEQEQADKQREIMLARQKEFEKKRQEQLAKGGTTNRDGSGGGVPPRTATPTKVSKDKELPEPERLPSRPQSKEYTAIPVSTNPIIPLKKVSDTPPKKLSDNTGHDLPPPSPRSLNTDQPAKKISALDAEGTVDSKVASKYMLDSHDLNARRSKNVHDLAMYGKDVTRRASFNPRPSENPFTPEMQEKMRAGHEAMIALELEKKQNRMDDLTDSTASGVPAFEDEERKDENKLASAGDAELKRDESSIAEEVEKQDETGKKEEIDMSLDTVTPKEKHYEDDPSVAKFVARDPKDRLSKNIHDMSQYMAGAKNVRRMSQLPPPILPVE